jgi:hypothetical protein
VILVLETVYKWGEARKLIAEFAMQGRDFVPKEKRRYRYSCMNRWHLL